TDGTATTGTLVRWGLRAMYFRRLLSMAGRIICPSRYVASYFTRFGAETTRIRVIPNGVSVQPACSMTEVHSTPLKRGTLNVAFLGCVVAHKGTHLILDALQLARLSSVDLVVFGEVADRGYARSLRERAAAIPDLRFRMYGAYDPAELPHLL